jgi:multidrug efflux pump subunit AcrA (membrane-fusion protein)
MKRRKSIRFFTALLILSVSSCDKVAVQQSQAEETDKEQASEPAVVTLTEENRKHIQLSTQTAILGNLNMTLKAAGRVSLDMNKTAKITSPLEGRLTALAFDINDKVQIGDVLARVESPELLGKQLEIRSPIDGVVIERQGSRGEMIDRAKVMYTISQSESLWVIAEIKERDIAAVALDQDARFSVISYPDKRFHGRIARIGNQVEPDSRTLEVRIAVDNSDHLLKPGMFADVEIATTVLNNVLIIPDDALQTDGDERIAFIALDDTRFEKRVLTLGLEEQGKVQVLDGIKPGENVVTEGSFILKSEMLKGELGEDE